MSSLGLRAPGWLRQSGATCPAQQVSGEKLPPGVRGTARGQQAPPHGTDVCLVERSLEGGSGGGVL
jgi:hypothetical protein